MFCVSLLRQCFPLISILDISECLFDNKTIIGAIDAFCFSLSTSPLPVFPVCFRVCFPFLNVCSAFRLRRDLLQSHVCCRRIRIMVRWQLRLYRKANLFSIYGNLKDKRQQIVSKNFIIILPRQQKLLIRARSDICFPLPNSVISCCLSKQNIQLSYFSIKHRSYLKIIRARSCFVANIVLLNFNSVCVGKLVSVQGTLN